MKRKLIEVAVPLQAISEASAREKNISKGHPSTLHRWWARKPLAASRAVLFASLVDDPSSDPDRFPTIKAQEDERQRLFRILEELVQWESSTNQRVLEAARAEILRSTGGNPPPVLDPFSGGGSIPLEAQRLGLTAFASDLNPVAVLITKALIEYPARFSGRPPVSGSAHSGMGKTGAWHGTSGLTADVQHYARWMHDEAHRRIGHLYPAAIVRGAKGTETAVVIAWLWARTVRCQNPACGATIPLTSTFALSTGRGGITSIVPLVDKATRTIEFDVVNAPAPAPTKVGNGGTFRCLVCEEITAEQHVVEEGKRGRIGSTLLAAFVDHAGQRQFVAPRHAPLPPPFEEELGPLGSIPTNPRWFSPPKYGFGEFRSLFLPRQLKALSVFAELIGTVYENVASDAVVTRGDDAAEARAYGEAVATYLALSLDRMASYWSTLSRWRPDNLQVTDSYSRQALLMIWNFAEANPFSDGPASFLKLAQLPASSLVSLVPGVPGNVSQSPAAAAGQDGRRYLISTDPPYYDYVGYADVSDFFYVWLRLCLKEIRPELFRTVATPRAEELIADPFRHGGREASISKFRTMFRQAFDRIAEIATDDAPMTVYYAFKQSETSTEDQVGATSTGWETMLTALLGAGFQVVGTWPMTTELRSRTVAIENNSLETSIILACRRRSASAAVADRREFLAGLKAELPEALRALQHVNIAPVDLAQASIGPGMAVFSRYARVVEADGQPMTVRSALMLIDQVLAELLSHVEDDYDSDTRWAVSWFEQYGLEPGPFDRASVLARAKGVGVNGLERAGIVVASGGFVRLLGPDDFDESWDPSTDSRLTTWEVTHQLIRALGSGGEQGAADLLRRVGGIADAARDLAYRLHAVSERRRWPMQALAYNALVTSWPEITRLAASTPGNEGPQQTRLFQ